MIAIKSEERIRAPHYEPLALDFRLYLITDRHQIPGKDLLKATEDALKGGVKAVQLREKDLRTRELLRLAYEMRTLTLKYDARLFINDRADIAVAVDADGVQLTQQSMPPYALRRLAPRLIIGVSTHSIEEAKRAEVDGADFITLGPIFPTPSKEKYGEPLGLETLDTVTREVRIPVFAIGGIKPNNMKEVLDRGAEGIAVISGVYADKSVKGAAMKYLRQLK